MFWWLLAWAANFGLYCAVRLRLSKARRNLLRPNFERQRRRLSFAEWIAPK
jgi:hypothetical protein